MRRMGKVDHSNVDKVEPTQRRIRRRRNDGAGGRRIGGGQHLISRGVVFVSGGCAGCEEEAALIHDAVAGQGPLPRAKKKSYDHLKGSGRKERKKL